jgi:hypothetical protein
MKVLYRISDNGYVKPKLPNATKKNCLLNFMTHWPLEEVTVYKDRCAPTTEEFLTEYAEITGLNIQPIDGGSSAGSWRVVRDVALTLPDDEIVYFVEDDYFHLPNSRKAIEEGLQHAHYVTLYDAPDKYVPAKFGGNPFIEDDGADDTRVILTPTTHWRITNSTTMTFATRVGTLRADNAIWTQFTDGTHPHDFQAFLALRDFGRVLISPIPSLSTHCEPAWLAPRVDWSKL